VERIGRADSSKFSERDDRREIVDHKEEEEAKTAE
jgi:hypothetical protein